VSKQSYHDSSLVTTPVTTPHSMTGVPLAELLMKRRLHTQVNQLVPSVANCVRNKQSQQKAAHDCRDKEREILEGQAVYAKDFRNKKAWMSGTVVEKNWSSVSASSGRQQGSHPAAPRPCLKL